MTALLLVSPPAYRSDHISVKPRNTSLGWLLGIVLLGWLVRLAVVACVYDKFLDPARDHWEFGYEIGRVARSLTMGLGYSNPYGANTGPTALLTPVYPYLLASVFTLFGVYTKASALVFLAINTFFSAVTAVPVFLIARKTCDLGTARIAAWLWAFFPYAIAFSATTMWYHSFVALLLALIFLLVLSLPSAKRRVAWPGLGVLLGFAALTNPVTAGITLFLVGWLAAELRRQRKPVFFSILITMVTMVVTVLPWVARNQMVMHHPVIFKDGFWLEVCVGNVNNSQHWWDGTQHPSGSALEAGRYARLGELRYMEAKRQQGVDYIESHPGRYALRSVRRVVLMWSGFWSSDPAYLRQESFDPPNVLCLVALSGFSFLGLSRLFRYGDRRAAWLYLLVLLSFPIPYYLSHLDPGFRHPVDPLLVILASFAIKDGDAIRVLQNPLRNRSAFFRHGNRFCRSSVYLRGFGRGKQ